MTVEWITTQFHLSSLSLVGVCVNSYVCLFFPYAHCDIYSQFKSLNVDVKNVPYEFVKLC